MQYDIFKDEKEKAEARQALQDLTAHPGWAFLVRALKVNAAHFQEELRERKDFSHLQEVYALQDRISDLESFEQLPANLLFELQIDEPEPEEDLYPDK